MLGEKQGLVCALLVDPARVPLHLEAVGFEDWVLDDQVFPGALLAHKLRLGDVQAESWVAQQDVSRFPTFY